MMKLTWTRIAAALAALALLTACGERREEHQTEAHQHSDEHADDARDDVGAHNDETAHAEDEGSADHIELTDEAIAAAGIELATAGPVRVREVLTFPGVVRPNAERIRDVAARFPGVVHEVRARVGDSVQRGQVLAIVESNESLRSYDVAAPIAGVITQRRANVGEATSDAPLFTVADLSSVWVEIALFSRDVPRVRVGQHARVTSVDGALQGEGRVEFISPLGERDSQTLSARIALDNAARTWAPGLQAQVHLTLAEHEAPIAVRNVALQTVEGRTVVFVRTDDGFLVRPVAPGARDPEHTEIRAGLDADERYATTNSFVLKSALGAAEADHGH